MYAEVVMAGFGGQGVLLMGKLLAYAGLKAGREVTWFPAYGAEMRGGTCNCTVVISDNPIGSPVSRNPHAAIVLNLPSLDKFEGRVRPGGLIVVNTSLINRLPARTDVKVVPVPANEVAIQAGTGRAANMVALGAYLGATGIADPGMVKELLAEVFAHKPSVVPVNQVALDRGVEIGRAAIAAPAAATS